MDSIRLFFAGDFCSKPSTTHISVSEELKGLLESCDLRIVNFEVPLMPEPVLEQVPFFQNDDAPAFLKNLGFDLFSLANNHAFDCGDDGFRKTVTALGEDKTFGSGLYDEAYRVKIVEVKGVKIGFLALSYASQQGVFDDVSRHNGLGCAYINDLRVNHDIMAAKKEVDFLFVLPHDGIEYIDVPLPETIARYRDFIDYGADAVIGSHPHCPQGWETYKGKNIFYSLGNFFFNSKPTPDFQADKPHWYEGMCVIASIQDGQIFFEVVNTLNRANRELVLDNHEARRQHNELLCRYLQDANAYKKCLDAAIVKLSMEQELPIVDRFHVHQPLRKRARAFARKCLYKLKGYPIDTNTSLLMLLKNDSRRNLLIQSLKK